MTKEQRLEQVMRIVDSLTILMKSVHERAGFKMEVIGDRLYIYGNGEPIAALYILLHSRCANLCFYMGHDNKGPYLEVLAMM